MRGAGQDVVPRGCRWPSVARPSAGIRVVTFDPDDLAELFLEQCARLCRRGQCSTPGGGSGRTQAIRWYGSRQPTACGARSATTLLIHSAASADTWVSAAHHCGGRGRRRNPATVVLSRPTQAQTRRPVSWSTTTVEYCCRQSAGSTGQRPAIGPAGVGGRPSYTSPSTAVDKAGLAGFRTLAANRLFNVGIRQPPARPLDGDAPPGEQSERRIPVGTTNTNQLFERTSDAERWLVDGFTTI